MKAQQADEKQRDGEKSYGTGGGLRVINTTIAAAGR